MTLLDELERLRREYEKAETEAEREFYKLAAEIMCRKLEQYEGIQR